MTTTSPAPLSHRDRAVLCAVAAGRCTVSGDCGCNLCIDGMWCADQLVGSHLTGAGLIIVPEGHPGPVQFTPLGRALLEAA